jgi:3'(2'), 5'-bisphosphate nucleotidase
MRQLIDLAHEAGRAVMAIYAKDFGHRMKDDATPVTDADLAAEAVILAGLARIAPDVPVISEEAAAAGAESKTGESSFSSTRSTAPGVPVAQRRVHHQYRADRA